MYWKTNKGRETMKGKTVNKTLCGALTAIMLISLLMMPQAVNALEPTN